jgi:nucleoside-diphosphate-sugar epimerase
VLKLAATRLVLGAGRPIGPVVLRVFNPIGAGMADGTLAGRAARRLRAALREGRHSIRMGPLGAHRDFVPARDVARAVLAVAERDAVGGVINVASGRPTLVRDLVDELAAIAGFEGTIAEDAPASHRSAEVDWQAADIDRAARLLGWHPTYGLTSALEELWRSVDALPTGSAGETSER